MDPRAAFLIKIADDIAEMNRRLVFAAGSDFEALLKLSLARMQWMLDGLIDDSEGVIETMPWWLTWQQQPNRPSGNSRNKPEI